MSLLHVQWTLKISHWTPNHIKMKVLKSKVFFELKYIQVDQ